MSALDDLKKAIADAPKRLVQIDDKLYVYVSPDDGKVDLIIKNALANGKTVIENGTSQWVEFWPVRAPDKSGSDAYTWRKDGNSIRTEKILFTKNPKNEVTQKSLGFVWKDALTVI